MLFFVHSTFADLSTEAYIFLEPKKVNQLISSFVPKKFEINNVEFKLDNFKILDGMEFERPSLSLSLASVVKSSHDGELVGYLLLEEGELRLRNFKYREVRYIDGGVFKAKVNIKVDCTELVLGFKNSVGFFEVKPRFKDGVLDFPKNDRKFSFEPKETSVDLSQCEGPSNIETLFVGALKEWLDSDGGQSFVEEKTFATLSGYVTKLMDTQLSSFVFLNNESSIDLTSLDFVDKIWRIGTSLKVKNEKTSDIKYAQAPRADASNKNKIEFPKSAFSHFIPDLFESVNLPINVKRSQIPGVEKLFNNRLIQFFVWSDLSNFKRDVNFGLDIFFLNNKLSYLGQKNGQIYYRIENNHWMDMNFLGEEQKFPYVQLLGDTEAQVGLKFEEGLIKMQLSDIKADTNVNWHPQMMNWRKSETKSKPNLSVVIPSVLGGLEGFKHEFSLMDLLGGKNELVKDLELVPSDTGLGLSFN